VGKEAREGYITLWRPGDTEMGQEVQWPGDGEVATQQRREGDVVHNERYPVRCSNLPLFQNLLALVFLDREWDPQTKLFFSLVFSLCFADFCNVMSKKW
jgi:hypothetical protein